MLLLVVVWPFRQLFPPDFIELPFAIKVKLVGFGKYKPVEIRINKNQAIAVKLLLALPAGEVFVGMVAYDEADPPGTTTISQMLLRSLPH